MKLPWISGSHAPDFKIPTRREFLKRAGGAAMTLSINPAAVSQAIPKYGAPAIGSIVSLLSDIKISSTFNPFEGDVSFNDSARSDLLVSKEVFFRIFGEGSELLKLINLDKSCIFPTNKGAGNNILDNACMSLVFDIPGKNNQNINELTLNLGPSDFGANDFDVHKGYWYLKSGGNTYNIPRITGDVCTSLKGPPEEIIKNISSRAVNNETGKSYTKEIEDRQLPTIQTEFSELMNQVLSGKIEITDEVRHRVWYLTS